MALDSSYKVLIIKTRLYYIEDRVGSFILSEGEWVPEEKTPKDWADWANGVEDEKGDVNSKSHQEKGHLLSLALQKRKNKITLFNIMHNSIDRWKESKNICNIVKDV